MRNSLLVITLLFSFSGCAQMEWVNPNKKESDFYTDKYKCEQQAASTFPTNTANIAYTSGTQQPTVTNCTGTSYGYGDTNTSVNCVSTSGTYTPPATVLVDTNANNRNEAFSSCMYSNGWRLQKKGGQMVRTQNQYN